MLTVRIPACNGRLYHLFFGSLLLFGALALPGTEAHAAGKRPPPTVAEMLALRPKQDGVAYTIPEPDKINTLKVDKVSGQKGGSGWILKDAEGKTLRLFFDSNDDDKVDVWSYYKDGVEVYREIDTTFKGGYPDQYRWLNAGGSKWGIDDAKDGRIKYWKVISTEEVSQEILAALTKGDFGRLQALMMSDPEMKALDLPAGEVARIKANQKEAKAKFDEAVTKLPALTAKAVWQYLQTDVPHLAPGDQTGSRFDLVKHSRGTIVFTPEKGDVGMVQTGELIQVGTAWRITSAPVAGGEAPLVKPENGTGGTEVANTNPMVEKLIKELTTLDSQMPKTTDGTDPLLVKHFLARADLLEKIIAVVEEKERDGFIRQLADSLSSSAQSCKSIAEAEGLKRLLNLEGQLVKALPGRPLTAYVTYREMQAEYTLKLADPKGDFNKTEAEWIDRLTKFIATYPTGEDTPDAILQAGQTCELPSLNKETEAKNWYLQLKKSYADKPQAVKANGALRRLEADGQPFVLAGPTVADPNAVFDMEKLRGKIVVVYYWASWNTQCLGDFAKLKLMMETHGKNGVELVAVNVDGTTEEVRTFLARSPAPGIHLHQDGGLESKLATDFGIMTPPQMFLVGRDGKVVSHTVRIDNLEEEMKKLK